MAEETLRAFLDRRERELEHQIAGLRGALKEKEAELADIVKARAAIPGTLGDAGRRQNALLGSLADVPSPFTGPTGNATNALQNPFISRTIDLGTLPTIQQMVQRALKDAFPQGASPHLLRAYMQNVFGMNVQPDSLRSQLARMKNKGVISKSEDGDMWELTLEGRGYEDPSKLEDDD
ncbi:MAG: hypothetical protein ACLQJL_04900 [Roseiarcus sp.]